MAELRQNAAMISGEKAYQKEKRLKVVRGTPHFRIEGDNLMLLSGPYADFWVTDLWNKGPDERDYIYKYVYTSKDLEVKRIVKRLFCQ